MGSTYSAAVAVLVAHLLFVFPFHVSGRRDYETKPPKLRLLAEIRANPHRNDLNWKAEPEAPIDYCYVRPNHIPTINSMCHEFFWPGKILPVLGFLRRKWFCSEKKCSWAKFFFCWCLSWFLETHYLMSQECI